MELTSIKTGSCDVCWHIYIYVCPHCPISSSLKSTSIRFVIQKMNVDSSEEAKQLLFRSCEDGSLATVQELLTQHSDLRAQIDSLKDAWGNTALIVATEKEHTGIVKVLLEYGANANKENNTFLYGAGTALTRISERGDSNLEIIDLLLRHGAQVDLQISGGNSALIVAAQNRQIKVAAKLVREYRVNIHLKNNSGWTALMMASQVGCTEIVKLLLDQGAEVDNQDNNEWTALIIASYYGNYEIVKLLLKFGANVNIKARNYETALILASQEKHIEIVELLIEYGAKDDLGIVLSRVAASKDIRINTIKLLLKQVVSKAEDHQWMQDAVNGASETGRIDIVELLLEHGADDLGWALVLAILNKHSDVVELLLEHDTHVDDNKWDCTLNQPPLAIAVEKEDAGMVKLLLEHGAKHGLGWAITKAILNEHAEIIQMLSEYGARADDSDLFESEPTWFESEPTLVTACKDGNANVVKLLLEHGARKYLGLALTEAILNRHTEIIQLLSEYGAQVNDENWDNDFHQPPLVIAVKNEDIDVVRLLLEHGAKAELGWAIREAIWNEQTEIVQILSEHGAQVDDDDEYSQGMYDMPILVEASKIGNTNIVKLLLRHGAKEHCRWALTEAILHKNTEVIDLLLEHGVYVADEGHRGESGIDPAIVEASKNGDIDSVKLLLKYGEKEDLEWALGIAATIEIAKLLIEHGAKIDEIDRDFNTTPLVAASEIGNTNLVELLLNHGTKKYLPEALIMAIVNKHTGIIELLTQHGAQVDDENWFDFDIQPALVEASNEGDINTVKLLLEHGAVKYLDWALEVASKKGHIKIVKVLLNHGVQVGDHNMFYTDALVEASKNGDTSMVRFLLEQGIINHLGLALRAASGKGHSHILNFLFEYGSAEDLGYALIEASRNDHAKVIKFLIEHDVFVDFQDEKQTTALIVASQSGHTEAIKLLVECGAQINHQNSNGTSAMILACQYGHIRAVEVLLQLGALVNMQDKNKLSALMIASQNGHAEITEFLLAHGAQVDLQNAEGWSPLMKASHKEEVQHNKQEEEAHLTAIENAIKETGTLDHTLLHGVFVGPPRSGKDSLMKRLLGEVAPNISPSTGVVETAIHVKVEESCTYAAIIGQSNWTRLAYDEEALHLMKTASSKHSTNCQFEGENSDTSIQVVDPPTAMDDSTPDAIDNAHKQTTQTDSASDRQPEMDPKCSFP